MDTVICPHCDLSINVANDPQVGQRLLCPACKARLEIICIAPLEADWQFHEPDRSHAPVPMMLYYQKENVQSSPSESS